MGRSGELVTNLSGEATYQSFKPSPLPPNPELNINSDIVKKLVEANRDLVRLDTAAKLIPNVELFISMYVRKEALISSQIEGTQCTLDDVLDPDVDGNTNLDVGDVINYVRACTYAIGRLEKLPLCNRLLREIHQELLAGIRGQEKNPGEFRRSQNWIGAANCSLKEARYIPPNIEDMNTALTDLERYMNEGDDYDPLIRIALLHYQFETIHPFLDGNGRVGRLIALKECLRHNVTPFIIEDYKKHYYYRGLAEWRNEKGWLIDTCLDGQDTFVRILDMLDIHISVSLNFLHRHVKDTFSPAAESANESANESARLSEALKIQYLDPGSTPTISTTFDPASHFGGVLSLWVHTNKLQGIYCALIMLLSNRKKKRVKQIGRLTKTYKWNNCRLHSEINKRMDMKMHFSPHLHALT